MITDRQNRVTGAAPQLIAGTGALLSTDTIDLGQARNVGIGEPFPAVVTVDVAFAGGTSIQVELIQADDAALTTNVTVVGASAVIALAALTAGRRLIVAQLNENPAFPRGQRFLGVRVQRVGTFTTGSFTANFVHDVQTLGVFYPANFVVQ